MRIQRGGKERALMVGLAMLLAACNGSRLSPAGDASVAIQDLLPSDLAGGRSGPLDLSMIGPSMRPDLLAPPGHPGCGNMLGLQANAAWPMADYCPTHRGRSPYAGPKNPKVRIVFSAIASFYTGFGPPVIDADGTIYIGSADNRVYAIDPKTGALKWYFESMYERFNNSSSPAIGADGTVYVKGDALYALDGRTGQERWRFTEGQGIGTSLSIGADGTIYFGGDGDYLYAVDGASGLLKWKYLAEAQFLQSSPAIGDDGTIYIGTGGGVVHAISGADGKKVWSFSLGMNNLVQGGPSIGADGTVYVSGDEGTVYALDGATGVVKWSHPTGGVGSHNVSIADDGTLYVVSRALIALDPATGRELWRVPSAGYRDPVIDAAGNIYTNFDQVEAYDKVGNRLWSVPDATFTWGVAIGADGTLYAGGGLTGHLYAIGP